MGTDINTTAVAITLIVCFTVVAIAIINKEKGR